jgi:hypothetical protein
VDVCAVAAGDVEGGGGVRMRDVFAGEEGDVTVCAVDIFLYGADSEVSKSSDFVRHDGDSKRRPVILKPWLTNAAFLLSPPFLFFGFGVPIHHPLPPSSLQANKLIPLRIDQSGPFCLIAGPVVDTE